LPWCEKEMQHNKSTNVLGGIDWLSCLLEGSSMKGDEESKYLTNNINFDFEMN